MISKKINANTNSSKNTCELNKNIFLKDAIAVFFGYTSIYSYCVLESKSVAFCHIEFQNIPSLMLFTLTDDLQFYSLQVSFSNILMIGLFRSNNRMLLFPKTEKTYHSKHVRDHIFVISTWKRGGGGLKICHVFAHFYCF